MPDIKLINGKQIYFDETAFGEEVKSHFANPYNYTKEILEEWDSLPFKGLITESDKVVLDIGANISLFALHIAPYAEKIILVEPLPEHIVVQKRLMPGILKEAGCATEIYHEESALENHTGKTNFHRCTINTTMASLDYQNREEGFEVNCLTLWDLCRKYNLYNVDLCKLDIEGSEFKAITVETAKPVSDIIKKFLLETHPRSRESQDHFKAIFEECGYKVDYVDFNGSILCYK